MANRQTTNYLTLMCRHLVWFLKITVSYVCISLVTFVLCYVLESGYSSVYSLVVCMLLTGAWCKLRRYRIKDKTKIIYTYVVIVLSLLTQIFLDRGVLTPLYTLCKILGGE